MNVNPAKTPAATATKPYNSPKLTIRRDAADEPSPLLAAVVAAAPLPPKPVYATVVAADVAAAPAVPLAVAAIVEIVEVFTRVGF